MKKTILIFTLLVIAILFLFQISKYTLLFNNSSIEIIIAIIAIVFFIIGIFINKKSLQKDDNLTVKIAQKKIEALEISKREYQVLEEINKGLSNKEIADKLFLSESTIKTHVSNLLSKLNAKRRTQAIQKAKELHILN